MHEPTARALEGVAALPAHVLLEAYSVLARLPSGLAVPAAIAADVLARRFPEEPLSLPVGERAALPGTLAAAEISGGAAYDGLIALEARANRQPLLTLDERAQETYRRLAVPFEPLLGA
jgi:hypothetical protein